MEVHLPPILKQVSSLAFILLSSKVCYILHTFVTLVLVWIALIASAFTKVAFSFFSFFFFFFFHAFLEECGYCSMNSA